MGQPLPAERWPAVSWYPLKRRGHLLTNLGAAGLHDLQIAPPAEVLRESAWRLNMLLVHTRVVIRSENSTKSSKTWHYNSGPTPHSTINDLCYALHPARAFAA